MKHDDAMLYSRFLNLYIKQLSCASENIRLMKTHNAYTFNCDLFHDNFHSAFCRIVLHRYYILQQ